MSRKKSKVWKGWHKKKRIIVEPIKWVRLAGRLKTIHGKAKMAQSVAYGLKYEKDFTQWMLNKYPKAIANPWIEGEDQEGYFLCQPDLVLLKPFIIFECKVKYTKAAYVELETLYKPVVSSLWDVGVPKLVQVCQHLTKDAKEDVVLYTFSAVKKSEETKLTYGWSPR